MSRGTFAVPEHARAAWDHMHRQIIATGPTPCADVTVRDEWTGTPAEQRSAADACLDCLVLEQCLDYALTADEDTGIWGGLTPAERSKRGAA